MAYDENSTRFSYFPAVEDDGFHQIRSSLSRLSICTSSVHSEEETIKNHPKVSAFTPESFDGGAEADGEVSDDGRGKENVREWDSDKESPRFYSLPTTPCRRRKKLQVSDEFKCDLRKQRKVLKEKKKRKGINGGGREGLTVLTRAKGGENSLRMGLQEVKACRDLGFELEAPGRIYGSTGSYLDTPTSSGSNSPIATWRISSPGDDPKEVKARLKVWAQAVALASSSRQA